MPSKCWLMRGNRRASTGSSSPYLGASKAGSRAVLRPIDPHVSPAAADSKAPHAIGANLGPHVMSGLAR